MLYNTLHNRWLRIVAAVVGELIVAASMNLFIVPLHLYTGGAMGVCVSCCAPFCRPSWG